MKTIFFILISFCAFAQPGDPSGDPDLIKKTTTVNQSARVKYILIVMNILRKSKVW